MADSNDQNNSTMNTPVMPGTPTTPRCDFHIPSPIIHRRNRTVSQCEKIKQEPVEHGKISFFSRSKGHGFVTPNSDAVDESGVIIAKEPIFFHIYDIEGEYVPHVGDDVEYRKILIPPKNEKLQAVHVRIINFTPERHETWSEPIKK